MGPDPLISVHGKILDYFECLFNFEVDSLDFEVDMLDFEKDSFDFVVDSLDLVDHKADYNY